MSGFKRFTLSPAEKAATLAGRARRRDERDAAFVAANNGKPTPADPTVEDHLDAFAVETLVSSPAAMTFKAGLAKIPPGKRRVEASARFLLESDKAVKVAIAMTSHKGPLVELRVRRLSSLSVDERTRVAAAEASVRACVPRVADAEALLKAYVPAERRALPHGPAAILAKAKADAAAILAAHHRTTKEL